MQYIKVRWMSHGIDDPALIYCELDERRWEVRKVELFKDGRLGFADRDKARLGTTLSDLPIPSIAEIATDVQFEVVDITSDEFDKAWHRATKGDKRGPD